MLNIGSLDAEKIYVGNDEVDKIFLGNTEIWSSTNKFIINVSSVILDEGGDDEFKGLRFEMTINGDVSVTFDNETLTFSLGEGETSKTVTPTFSRASVVTGNLIISGSFTNITSSIRRWGTFDYAYCWQTHYIVKWYKNDSLFTDLLVGLDVNTVIPNNITKIYHNRFGNVVITLPNNVEYIEKMIDGLSGATLTNDIYYINNIACGYYNTSRTEPVTIANGTTMLAAHLFSELLNDGYSSNSHLTGINFPTDGLLTKIPNNFFYDGSTAITTLTFPSSITSIGENAFRDFSNLTDIYFYADNITLPTAGSSSGAFYYKSATNITIHCKSSNTGVINYNWSGDNRTATIVQDL